MRILVVANGYPTPQDPQWGCFERDQAIALRELGHDVAILAVDTRFRRYKRKHGISVFQEDGLKVFWGYWIPTKIIKFRRLKNRITFFFYDKTYSKLLKEWGKPDVLFAHFQRNIFYSFYLRTKYDIPLVGMEHWSLLMQEQLPAPVIRRGEIVYPTVDKLLVVSKALSKSLQDKFNVGSEVVNDMLGPEFLDYTPDSRLDNKGIRFIAVGSLLPIKGYDLLIRAFAKSGLADNGCCLSIVGEGPARSDLAQVINDCNVAESVHLLGRKMKDEVVQALRDSDVFVLSSRSETFGVACIEALSQGLPCIATRCGGPDEIVTEKDGILIDPENETALAEAMVNLSANYAQYNRAEIANRCINRYSPKAIATQLTGIFEDVVNKYNKN